MAATTRAKHRKVTARLAADAQNRNDDDQLDVVVELTPSHEPSGAATTRQQKIAARKAAFDSDAAPIKQAIEDLGGEVLDEAWLNHTIRSRVPKKVLDDLADNDSIVALDVPEPLTAE
jgi:hypothetical protein